MKSQSKTPNDTKSLPSKPPGNRRSKGGDKQPELPLLSGRQKTLAEQSQHKKQSVCASHSEEEIVHNSPVSGNKSRSNKPRSIDDKKLGGNSDPIVDQSPAPGPSEIIDQKFSEEPSALSNKAPASAQPSLADEANRLAGDLGAFVHEAWKILEPVTPLCWNWHHELICEYLTLVKQHRFKERFGARCEGVIFNVPPRTMKSLLITVFFPVWLWAADPARRWMFASYSEKLSAQHSVFRRNVIQSEWFQQRWSSVFKFAKDQNLKTHYENSARGVMFATAMGATATGMGGDVLVFDDPLNPEQALSETEREAVNTKFDTTFRSRLNDPARGIKIIVMQRLHELDLTGHVLGKEASLWQHVKLPAMAETAERWEFPISGRVVQRKAQELLWPERLPEDLLNGMKVGMGSWAFAGQYQQNPAPMEGGIIKRNWIRFYRELPERFDLMVQSWDCTFKGESTAPGRDTDFVAGQVWGKCGGKYLMLPYRLHERLDFGPTKAAIKACHSAFPQAHAILIEDRANGSAIVSELHQEIPGIIAIDPEGGKLARAQSISPLWEAGSIELPDPQVFDGCGPDKGRPDPRRYPDVRSWVEAYIHNICTFPKAAHDDDMDATSQALIYIRHKMSVGIFDFYRRYNEIVRGGATRIQSSATSVSAMQINGDMPATSGEPCDANASGSPMHSLQTPRVPETLLTVSVRRAMLTAGGTIMCSRSQYPEVRQALVDLGTDAALAEVKRLDAEHG